MPEGKELHDQRLEVDRILTRAWDLYMERDSKYHGLWAEAGAQDNCFHMRHKAMRVWKVFEAFAAEGMANGSVLESAKTTKLVEDAFDLMNYAAFFIWCVEHGKFYPDEDGGGSAEEPPPYPNG